jgi:CheY-like chemotaxis protein
MPHKTPPRAETQNPTAMILLVDDDEAVLNLTRLMLEKAGLSVVTASDGQAAVELFQYGYDDIGAVLLDIAMPGMSGEETFRRLRAIRSDIPIFVCSGFGQGSVVQDFADLGFDGFFQKPYDFDKLIRMLRAAARPGRSE